MARRSDNKGSKNTLQDYKPIYLDFSERERAEIIKAASGGDYDFPGDLEQRIGDGWKVSLSHSLAWDNYILTITPKEVSGFSGGAVFMFRHKEYDRLLHVFRYFFSVMVEQGDKRLQGEVESTNW
jgi:hypothetical protein